MTGYVRCTREEPHEPHQHTIREGNITFAGGRCDGAGRYQGHQGSGDPTKLKPPVPPTPPPGERDRVREAALQVADAILDPGRSPDYHRFMLDKLRREWPVLYGAVMHLVAEVERKRVMDAEKVS